MRTDLTGLDMWSEWTGKVSKVHRSSQKRRKEKVMTVIAGQCVCDGIW